MNEKKVYTGAQMFERDCGRSYRNDKERQRARQIMFMGLYEP